MPSSERLDWDWDAPPIWLPGLKKMVRRPPARIWIMRRNLKRQQGRLRLEDLGDYYLVESYTTTPYVSSTVERMPSISLFLALGQRSNPRRLARIRSIVLYDKKWYSVKAQCILYASSKGTRLACTGEPREIDLLIDKYNPHTITTPYPPNEIEHCRGREVIEYHLRYSPIYICPLITLPYPLPLPKAEPVKKEQKQSTEMHSYQLIK